MQPMHGKFSDQLRAGKTSIECYMICLFYCITPMGKLCSSCVINNSNIATSLEELGFINVHRKVVYKLLSYCLSQKFHSHICDSFLDLLPNFENNRMCFDIKRTVQINMAFWISVDSQSVYHINPLNSLKLHLWDMRYD